MTPSTTSSVTPSATSSVTTSSTTTSVKEPFSMYRYMSGWWALVVGSLVHFPLVIIGRFTTDTGLSRPEFGASGPEFRAWCPLKSNQTLVKFYLRVQWTPRFGECVMYFNGATCQNLLVALETSLNEGHTFATKNMYQQTWKKSITEHVKFMYIFSALIMVMIRDPLHYQTTWKPCFQIHGCVFMW